MTIILDYWKYWLALALIAATGAFGFTRGDLHATAVYAAKNATLTARIADLQADNKAASAAMQQCTAGVTAMQSAAASAAQAAQKAVQDASAAAQQHYERARAILAQRPADTAPADAVVAIPSAQAAQCRDVWGASADFDAALARERAAAAKEQP